MEKVYGNTQGIKSSHLKQLQQLYEQRQPGDRFTTAKFAQQHFSHKRIWFRYTPTAPIETCR